MREKKNNTINILNSYFMDYSFKNKYNLGAGIKKNSFL